MGAPRPAFGWLWDWYSFCSAHHVRHDDCPRCLAGRWVFRPTRFIGDVIYGIVPQLWRWWANR